MLLRGLIETEFANLQFLQRNNCTANIIAPMEVCGHKLIESHKLFRMCVCKVGRDGAHEFNCRYVCIVRFMILRCNVVTRVVTHRTTNVE